MGYLYINLLIVRRYFKFKDMFVNMVWVCFCKSFLQFYSSFHFFPCHCVCVWMNLVQTTVWKVKLYLKLFNQTTVWKGKAIFQSDCCLKSGSYISRFNRWYKNTVWKCKSGFIQYLYKCQIYTTLFKSKYHFCYYFNLV